MINYVVLALTLLALMLFALNELWLFLHPKKTLARPLYRNGDLVSWNPFQTKPTGTTHYVIRITEVNESDATWLYTGEVFFLRTLKRTSLSAWCPRVSYEKNVPEHALVCLRVAWPDRVFVHQGNKLYMSRTL